MTATIDTGLDLDWVTFLDKERPDVCTYGPVPMCSADATHIAYYEPTGCNHRTKLYCLTHRDVILRDVPRMRGLFRCSACGPRAYARLLRMEPLR